MRAFRDSTLESTVSSFEYVYYKLEYHDYIIKYRNQKNQIYKLKIENSRPNQKKQYTQKLNPYIQK